MMARFGKGGGAPLGNRNAQGGRLKSGAIAGTLGSPFAGVHGYLRARDKKGNRWGSAAIGGALGGAAAGTLVGGPIGFATGAFSGAIGGGVGHAIGYKLGSRRNSKNLKK